jgi:hypothetical protein
MDFCMPVLLVFILLVITSIIEDGTLFVYMDVVLHMARRVSIITTTLSVLFKSALDDSLCV